MPKKVPPPTIPRLKVGDAVVGRSKLLKGGIMVFIFDQAERWVEEFLEGSRMIWMRYGDTSQKLEPEVPKMYRLHWSTASIFNVPCMYIAYGIDPCCMCPENQSELWLCLNLRSFPVILQETLEDGCAALQTFESRLIKAYSIWA